ncbi:MAG: hypothetical protein P4M13_03265 [Alphaproteobacteria bacterium]|nr:hypothetical protein [Alphaproteobacteria bacterium]
MTDNLPAAVVGESGDVAAPAPAPAKTATPPVTDVYTVTDVNADVTADTAAHARDKALLQAERSAYTQLCGRLNAADNGAKLDDDAMAALVQSFEVQSEHISPVRYIGVFTIRFKPSAAQKKIGGAVAAAAAAGEDKAQPAGPTAHLTVAVQTDSLAAWAQIKRRLGAVPQVAHIDTLDLGRGVSHIDLAYGGTLDDLRNAVTTQGFVLRQNGNGVWELFDGSMIAR